MHFALFFDKSSAAQMNVYASRYEMEYICSTSKFGNSREIATALRWKLGWKPSLRHTSMYVRSCIEHQGDKTGKEREKAMKANEKVHFKDDNIIFHCSGVQAFLGINGLFSTGFGASGRPG